MTYRAKFDVCSEIRTRYINAQCGQNVELLNVKRDVRTGTGTLLKFNAIFGDFCCLFN